MSYMDISVQSGWYWFWTGFIQAENWQLWRRRQKRPFLPAFFIQLWSKNANNHLLSPFSRGGTPGANWAPISAKKRRAKTGKNLHIILLTMATSAFRCLLTFAAPNVNILLLHVSFYTLSVYSCLMTSQIKTKRASTLRRKTAIFEILSPCKLTDI